MKSFESINAARKLFRKSVAVLCVLLISAGTCPEAAISQPNDSAGKVHVKTGPKSVSIFEPRLNIPENPTDEDISSARIFTESLIPTTTGIAQPLENQSLRTAVLAYRQKSVPEETADLENFLSTFPNSRWTPSLELNLARLKFETGYFSDALRLYKSSWNELKQEKAEPQYSLANESLAQLMVLSARLGKRDELAGYLKESKGRTIRGSAEEKVDDARTGLIYMEKTPEMAYKCGPYALNSVLVHLGKIEGRHPILEKAQSSHQGTNLVQLRDWAKACGLDYQIAKRAPGAPVLMPSVVHWKVGHFGAVLEKKRGRFHVSDPTFDTEGNFWLSQQALDLESDGYFLVPKGPLPIGWSEVSDSEGISVWGKGEAKGRDQNERTPPSPKACECGDSCGGGGGGGSRGMARATAFKMLATLQIEDTPIEYTPPLGPQMDFTLTYNHLESNQPTTPAFSTFGPDWNFNWVSYLSLDASGNATVRVRGGGSEVFEYMQPDNVSNPYAPDLLTQAVLTVTGKNSYERQLPDGSVEVFDQPDGTGRLFMTKVVDPQGNAVYIGYNSNFRVQTITDSLGQVSELSYLSNQVANIGYYKIESIEDPFGREAVFAYDSSKVHIVSITDVINLQSQFEYEPTSSFITSMRTPYGVTSFQNYVPKSNLNHNNATAELAKGIRFTFPDGTGMVLENWLNFEQKTYYWDRHALELYPGDPGSNILDHCEITQWQMINGSTILESAVVDWVKPPLESRITYGYEGDVPHNLLHYTGISNKPISVSRTIEGGATQTSSYEYNFRGAMTKSIDPIGRTISNFYSANGVDLLEVRETKGGNNFLLGKWQYNDQHLPILYIDGSGQKTEYSYNAQGQILTVTDANNNVTTYGYTNNYLTSIDGPLTGDKDKTLISYDGYGRPFQITDSVGYVVQNAYDAANRITKVIYPDQTFEQFVYDKLDQVAGKDRIGRWTVSEFNSLDELVKTTDPLGRTTHYQWCSCGSLVSLTDGAGNVTRWHHDLQGRTIEKIYSNQTSYVYEYEGTTTSGRLKRRTDALGQITQYQYNADDTLSAINYSNLAVPNSTSDVTLTWDSNYRRMMTVTNGWGTLTYTYNNYITNPFASPTTGGGMLRTVTNNVILNSGIEYFYDALGRTSKREINGASNRITWAYDAMSRVTSEVNALGTFNYSYVDQNAPGGDRGTTRLASIQYPNGQNTGFSYFDNTGDQRLQRISNLGVSGQILSQFDYGYDSAGQIKQWQQFQNERKICYNLAYDDAGQLTSARGGNGAPQSPYAKEYSYAYDPAANIVGSQTSVVENIKIGGTKTTGDVLTVTVFDTALPSGQKAVNYTVQSADTLTSIALNFATAITLDSDLNAAGINAAPIGTTIKIRSISRNLTTFAVSKSSGATETIQFALQSNGVTNAIISGAKTSGDTLTLIVKDPALPGGQQSISYAVQSADTLLTIAVALKNGINANANLSALGVTATSGIQGTFGVVSLKSNSQNITNYASSTSSNATEKISLIMNTNENHLAIVGQNPTVNDTISIQIFDASLPGGTQTVSYKVQTGNTAANVATALVNGINGNANLIAAQITASASGANITLESKSPNKTEYRSYADSKNSSILTLPVFSNVQTVTIGGTRTTGDILHLDIFHDFTFVIGIGYVVQSSDTTTSMAAGLAAAVNSNTSLQARGITAVSNSSVVYITSSRRSCAYLGSTSSGATETVTVGPSVGSTRFVCNNVNELVAQIPGGRIPITIQTEPATELLTVLTSVLAIFADAPNSTSYSKSQNDQTTIVLGPNMAGNTTGKFEGPGGIGGNVFLTIHDVRLPGGQKTVTASGNPRIQTMAAQLANTINSDAELRAIGIHARVSTATTSAWSQQYQGEIETTRGANAISARGGEHLISVDGPDFQTNFAYDANGNMTSDGTNTYEWDAENRLIKITYPGTGNNSQLTYDGGRRCVKIIEQTGGSTTSTKQFIWDDLEMCEERNAAGTLTNQYFEFGEKPSSNSRFYSLDGLASVREMTDAAGAITAQNLYGPWGRKQSIGTETSNMAFAGLYQHQRSGLALAVLRQYDSTLGRWISRDPAGEQESSNLFAYVENSPVEFYDPYGAARRSSNNSRRYPRRRVPVKCYTVSCCQDMRDRCADLCLVRWTLHWAVFHAKYGTKANPPGGYKVDKLNECRFCCTGRKEACIYVVVPGKGKKGFPTRRFNCPDQCLEDL